MNPLQPNNPRDMALAAVSILFFAGLCIPGQAGGFCLLSAVALTLGLVLIDLE